jgi:hypothetical protein
MNDHASLFEWRYQPTSASLSMIGTGARLQVAGKQYAPDHIERRTSDAGAIAATCHFTALGITIDLLIELKQSHARFSGTLHNRTKRPVHPEQLWLAECVLDLGGRADDYRVYYNSGCQESSGTCLFSEIAQATGQARTMLDPEDPDSITHHSVFASTCIQSDCIRSQYVTAIYCKQNGVAACVGATSFHRAETVFFIKPGPSTIAVIVSPVILYNHLQIDPGDRLALEQITIRFDRSPLTALESYVEQVAREKKLSVKPLHTITGLWNTWVAFSEAQHEAGAESQAWKYQEEHLAPYDIRSCPVSVTWQRGNAFFESRCKPHLGESFAEAAARMAERFPQFDLCGGLFWGAASEGSDFFVAHSEAVLQDHEGNLCSRGPKGSESWGRCPQPSYWVDFSHPASKRFFEDHLLSVAQRVNVKTFNLDFMGDHGEWRGAWGHLREDDNPFLNFKPYDAHLNRPFETDRVITQTIRQTLGDVVVIRSYTAFFMRHLGLLDVVRTAADASRVEYDGKTYAPPWDSLRGILQNLAANYMFHGKWWWSDACSLCVGTRTLPERTEEFRIRSLISFITGGPISVGDDIARMKADQFRYYTVNLPVTGHAARPIDLFERAVPEMYHFPKQRTQFGHDLLTLINLTNRPRVYEIALAELELDVDCIAFEFWTKTLVKSRDALLKFTVPALSARHYALHVDARIPFVLGTDFHLSMGAKELLEVRWDDARRMLRGGISRPAAETGCIYVWIPEHLQVDRVAPHQGAAVADGVLPLEIRATSAPTWWEVSFVGRSGAAYGERANAWSVPEMQ